jgi:hypothetical protein
MVLLGNQVKSLSDLGAFSLLKYKYNSSFPQLLRSVYPEHEWLPWKFEKVPNKSWGDTNTQRKFMDLLSKELKIKEPSDWYNITIGVICKLLKN